MLFPHKPKSCELLEIPGREDFGWNDNLFFFLASRARHLQFAKQIQDKVPSWAGWYSRAHRRLCHFLSPPFLLSLAQGTNCSAIPSGYLSSALLADKAISLSLCLRNQLPELFLSGSLLLASLFLQVVYLGVYVVRWLWAAEVIKGPMFDTVQKWQRRFSETAWDGVWKRKNQRDKTLPSQVGDFSLGLSFKGQQMTQRAQHIPLGTWLFVVQTVCKSKCGSLF